LFQLHQLLEGPESALQQQTLWRQMMLALLNRHARLPLPAKPGVEHRAVSQAKELLQARLAEPPSLEELAAAVNLSPFHFARVFQRATGMPPHTWLMQQRIAHARALLQQGCLPLAGRDATGLCRPEPPEPAIQKGLRRWPVYLTPIKPQLPTYPAATAPFTRPSQRRAAGH
jgi:AraC-like DNA-binding protein